jgi:hypothetical protein
MKTRRPVAAESLLQTMANLGGALNALLLLVLCTCYVDVARGQNTDPNEGKYHVIVYSIHIFHLFHRRYASDMQKLIS